MNQLYVAVWGMSSLLVAFVAACLCVVAAIWSAETAARTFGSVVVVAMFSLIAALFVQQAIDRRSPSTCGIEAQGANE